MNKTPFIVLLIVLILLLGGYFIWQEKKKQTPQTSQSNIAIDTSQNRHNNTPPENNPTSPVINIKPVSAQNTDTNTQPNDTIPSNWITYINQNLDFTFLYPLTWSKYGKETNAINLAGTVMSRMVNFIDTVSKTTLFIKYHVEPYGKILFEKKFSEYKSSQGLFANGGKQIEVAANNALEAVDSIFTDNKGNALNQPLLFVFIVFLDKKKTGEIELQLKTPLMNSEIEVAKFKQLLSTFKFIN